MNRQETPWKLKAWSNMLFNVFHAILRQISNYELMSVLFFKLFPTMIISPGTKHLEIMVPGACTCYLVRCWMCWRHQLVKKGKSLKKDFWISWISVGVLIPCCVSRQCSACFPPLKSKSTSCWEHRLRLNENKNKNFAILKCITFLFRSPLLQK